MYGLRFVIAGEDGFMGGIVALWHCGIAVMDLLFQELTLPIIVTDTKKVCM